MTAFLDAGCRANSSQRGVASGRPVWLPVVWSSIRDTQPRLHWRMSAAQAALAARNLPAHLRKKAIIWGTFGAIAVRTSMTLVVVWLLKIPGLLLAGGVLLGGMWVNHGKARAHVAAHLIDVASLPGTGLTEVIAGDSISDLERFGIPAGVGAALVLLFVAVL